MSALLQILRENLRNNFGPTVFLIVAGFIAFLFIGYLIIDYIKALLLAARRRKMLRDERKADRL